jgi:hypothetical protein
MKIALENLVVSGTNSLTYTLYTPCYKRFSGQLLLYPSLYSMCLYSFVCHSLGGIVVRSALTCDIMIPYRRHCYTYVTLASPHCGYLYGDNSLLSTGMYVECVDYYFITIIIIYYHHGHRR